MQTEISILIVENQTLTRIGLRTVLGREPDFKIIGEAADGAEGLAIFRSMRPRVTILSLRLPDSCAIDALAAYFAIDKTAKILILADTAGDAEIRKTLKQGASGYICKDIEEDELVKAIRVISAGKKYIPADIAGILSENLGQEELTNAEKNVLHLLAVGKANKEIAFDLLVSENTIKTHVKNIFDKLGVSDRTTAATTAIKRGLVRIDI